MSEAKRVPIAKYVAVTRRHGTHQWKLFEDCLCVTVNRSGAASESEIRLDLLSGRFARTTDSVTNWRRTILRSVIVGTISASAFIGFEFPWEQSLLMTLLFAGMALAVKSAETIE